jgi:hypothetical protein
MEEAERLLGKALRAFPESTRVRLSYAELFELRVHTFELNSNHPTFLAYSARKAYAFALVEKYIRREGLHSTISQTSLGISCMPLCTSPTLIFQPYLYAPPYSYLVAFPLYASPFSAPVAPKSSCRSRHPTFITSPLHTYS